MRIQHNILAMNAYRNYTNNTSALGKNLEKLSSGYKINRAGDDAAGLAISEKMRAQITGLNAATKNAKDGVSLVKTAEGALSEVHDMLNRMVSLATQSANGTYDNETDRIQLQKEMDQLKEEINRIADSSNFNGIKLLDGSMDASTISGVNYNALSDTKLQKLFTNGWGNETWTGKTQGDVDNGKYVLETEGGSSSRAGFQISLDNVNVTTDKDGGTFTLDVGGNKLTVDLEADQSYDGTTLARLIADKYGYGNIDKEDAFKIKDTQDKEHTFYVSLGGDGKTLNFSVDEDDTDEFSLYEGAEVTWSVGGPEEQTHELTGPKNKNPLLTDNGTKLSIDLTGMDVPGPGKYKISVGNPAASNADIDKPDAAYEFEINITDDHFDEDGNLIISKVAQSLADKMKENTAFASQFKSIEANENTVVLTAKDSDVFTDAWTKTETKVEKATGGDDDKPEEKSYTDATGTITITWPTVTGSDPQVENFTSAAINAGAGNNSGSTNTYDFDLDGITVTEAGDVTFTIGGLDPITITVEEGDINDSEAITTALKNALTDAETGLFKDNLTWSVTIEAGSSGDQTKIKISTVGNVTDAEGEPELGKKLTGNVTAEGVEVPDTTPEPTWATSDTITFTWADADGEGHGLTFTGKRNDDGNGWDFTVTGDALDALGLTNADFTVKLMDGETALSFTVSADNMEDPSKLGSLDLSGNPTIASSNAAATGTTGTSDFVASVEDTTSSNDLSVHSSGGTYVEKGSKQENQTTTVDGDYADVTSINWDDNYADFDATDYEGTYITLNLEGGDSVTLKLTSGGTNTNGEVDIDGVTSAADLIEKINDTLAAYLSTYNSGLESADSGQTGHNAYNSIEVGTDGDGNLTVSYNYTAREYEGGSWKDSETTADVDGAGTAGFDTALVDAATLAGKTITINLETGDSITLTLKNGDASNDDEVEIQNCTTVSDLVKAINSQLETYLTSNSGDLNNKAAGNDGSYNKYTSVVLADDGNGGFTVTYDYTEMSYSSDKWNDGSEHSGVETGTAVASATLTAGDKPTLDWDALTDPGDLSGLLNGKSISIELETGAKFEFTFTSGTADEGEIKVESTDTADDIIGKINDAIAAKLSDINGQLEASAANSGNADYNVYSDVVVAADGNGGLTVTYTVQEMTYEEEEEPEQLENSSKNIFGGDLTGKDYAALVSALDTGDLETNLNANGTLEALQEYFTDNGSFDFLIEGGKTVSVDLSNALKDLSLTDKVTMKDVYAAIAETVNKAVKSQGLQFQGITSDAEGKNWIYGGPDGKGGYSTQGAGDGAYMWLTELNDEDNGKTGLGSGTIDIGLQNVTDNVTGASAQLANTTVNFDNVNAWQDGAKIRIGDTTYTVAIGENSKFKNVANVIDLTDLDKSKLGSETFNKIAAQRLTVAAKDNSIFIVGHNGKGETTLKQRSEVKDTTDMSTKERLLSYLGVSTADANSITNAKPGKALTLQIGDTAESYNQLNVSISDCHTQAMGIADIDISTQSGAAAAVDKIKSAINYVSDVRGTLGATQNRLEHTQNNLSVMTENIQDAESTIRDTDVAEEMMSYVKNNILIQSAQAMLAQANQIPQGVLQLLG